MKTNWIKAIIAVAAMIGMPQVTNAQRVDMEGGKVCFALLAGQTIEAGTVCVEVDANDVVVTYTTTGGWELFETHTWVGTDLADLPKNKGGNPVLGAFTENSGPLPSGTTFHEVKFSLDAIGFGCPQLATLYFLAAHAAVCMELEDGEVVQTETGWSEGSRITPKGNWATYSNFTLTCEPEEIEPPAVEYNEETAWVAGTRYNVQGNWATYVTYPPELTAVPIFAGQTIPVGFATFSAPAEDGDVTITLDLNPGMAFQDVEENVKVQDYEEAPSGNPSPGSFEHKASATGSSWTIKVPENNFYGVHLDVLVPKTMVID